MGRNKGVKISQMFYQKLQSVVLRYRSIFDIASFLFLAVLANYLAFLLRFEIAIPERYIRQFMENLPWLLLCRLGFYLGFRLHKNLWRYTSISDLTKIVAATILGSLSFLLVTRYGLGNISYPRSVYIIDTLLLIVLVGGKRLSLRIFKDLPSTKNDLYRILLIGAGDSSEILIREMKGNPNSPYDPIGFIDEDPYKKGLSIHGLPIFGGLAELGKIITTQSLQAVLVSLSEVSSDSLHKVYQRCQASGIAVKILPRQGRRISQIRPLFLEDLLQREPLQSDLGLIEKFISGKIVLITGAGGSIGSELCRQVLSHHPEKLLLLERYENSLHKILLETTALAAQQDTVVPIIADITDVARLEYVFSAYRPQIVFHAAAHKHVSLMEDNPLEAVKNNIFGTKKVLEISKCHNVENFVLVSTDKAVDPTSMMGATKRIAEYLAVTMQSQNSTRFSVVRFGNVLGSNGSVVPIFQEQLSNGGPLTVTHPEVKRYFMLIPEAVQLVLLAAALGEGGEIFVFDMGEQIKIVDLAENLIRLSGLTPYKDIKIEFIGLKPGEKLEESLFDSSEKVTRTKHDKLFYAIPQLPQPHDLQQCLAELEKMTEEQDIRLAMRRLLPSFH